MTNNLLYMLKKSIVVLYRCRKTSIAKALLLKKMERLSTLLTSMLTAWWRPHFIGTVHLKFTLKDYIVYNHSSLNEYVTSEEEM